MENIRILIVEDDVVLARELQEFLSKWGYMAVCAKQFDNLIEEMSLYAPKLVLMDINLPFYDGFYWCFKIRESSNVPVYLSAAEAMIKIRSWQSHKVEMTM